MLSFLFFSVSRAWQGFWRNAAMSLAATATMTLMLLLLSGFWILQAGLLASIEFVEQRVEVVADLYDGTTTTQGNAISARLRELPGVREVVYVSKEEALRRYQEQREDQGQEDLTPYLDSNPLPASIEVSLREASDYQAVTEALTLEPRVEKVKNIADTAERLTT